MISGIPDKTGVYLLQNRSGEIIYIGKSKNIRQRVRTHISGKSTWRNMSTSIADVSYKLTKTELEALILEDRLIKKHRPIYNSKQKKIKASVFIAIADYKLPCLRVVDHDFKGKFLSVYGPYKDKFLAERIMEIAKDFCGMRRCETHSPKGCLNKDLSRCSAPCTGEANGKTKNYRKSCIKCTDLLCGKTEETIHTMFSSMKRAAARHDFEKAAFIKNEMEFMIRFTDLHEFSQNFRSKNLVMYEKGRTAPVHVFRYGKLVKVYKRMSADISRVFDKLPAHTRAEDPRYILDRARIVYSWIKNNNSVVQFI